MNLKDRLIEELSYCGMCKYEEIVAELYAKAKKGERSIMMNQDEIKPEDIEKLKSEGLKVESVGEDYVIWVISF